MTGLSISTPLRAAVWHRRLAGLPDRSWAHRLVHDIIHGVDIGYTGRRTLRVDSRNFTSTPAEDDAVSRSMEEEVALGRIAGPFASPPYQYYRCSPIKTVLKKSDTASSSTCRIRTAAPSRAAPRTGSVGCRASQTRWLSYSGWAAAATWPMWTSRPPTAASPSDHRTGRCSACGGEAGTTSTRLCRSGFAHRATYGSATPLRRMDPQACLRCTGHRPLRGRLLPGRRDAARLQQLAGPHDRSADRARRAGRRRQDRPSCDPHRLPRHPN